MDLIRVFSEASPTLLKGLSTTIQNNVLFFSARIGNRRFRLSVWYIENQTAAVDYEILYLVHSGNTDAGSRHFISFSLRRSFLKWCFNADIRIDVLTASLITLTLNAGAYMSRFFRGTIESVNKGQTESCAGA